MAVSIEVCIPSRDECINTDVLSLAHAACTLAGRAGLSCGLARVSDRYSTCTSRNRGVAGFLARNQFSHLLFVDDDVLIPPHTLHNLAQVAERHPQDVLCGCVPSIKVNPDTRQLSFYVQVRKADDWYRVWPEGVVETEACGGGCMLIPKTLLLEVGHPWFRWPECWDPKEGLRANTDDADFCERIRDMGRKVWAVGTVRCGHLKTVDVGNLIPSAV